MGHRELARVIDADTVIVGLEAQLKCVGAGRVTHASISNEPDASFKPTNVPPGRSNQWPTVVVECGDSETTAHLRCIADLWIGNSGGQMTVVIIISVDWPPRRVIFENGFPKLPSRTVVLLPCANKKLLLQEARTASQRSIEALCSLDLKKCFYVLLFHQNTTM
ncbi:hypothetical protein ASPWEDRAFT_207582 [Aspergillus wentii DTO 134E9]|uniref:Uncharacterized protein n=1 Tax=Aspergillus wentii DTO 134E9 TaxID=1073089 RepID=A0A1L9S003_ASPWE|nr:uncharacterized protein ASPWEDRAFT_207582 [Aspergillus wentii DTO 134E9]OJJ40398.1 hypothetical protein ASPWEDRAFT_207582 [Aspergillus wentii DTO 134E9]